MFGIIGTAIGLGIMAKVAGSACHTLDRSCQPQRNNYPQRRYNYRPHYNNRINNYTYHQNNNYKPRYNNKNQHQKKKRNGYWKLKVI